MPPLKPNELAELSRSLHARAPELFGVTPVFQPPRYQTRRQECRRYKRPKLSVKDFRSACDYISVPEKTHQ